MISGSNLSTCRVDLLASSYTLSVRRVGLLISDWVFWVLVGI